MRDKLLVHRMQQIAQKMIDVGFVELYPEYDNRWDYYGEMLESINERIISEATNYHIEFGAKLLTINWDSGKDEPYAVFGKE